MDPREARLRRVDAVDPWPAPVASGGEGTAREVAESGARRGFAVPTPDLVNLDNQGLQVPGGDVRN